MHDPWFTWLRPLSQLVVRLDEVMDRSEREPSLDAHDLLDAARQLKVHHPGIKIIGVTMHADTAYVRAAFKAGASGCLLKRSAAEELEQAIRAVLSGNYYVTPLITKEVMTSLLSPAEGPTRPGDEPTMRQREVLNLLAEGRSAKEIAAVLKISPRTVEFHKSQMMEHLDLRTTAELIKYALTHGIITS
jgi:DNA-binding NarL/FixJ family response regulator